MGGSRMRRWKGRVAPTKDLATPLEAPTGRYKSTEGAPLEGLRDFLRRTSGAPLLGGSWDFIRPKGGFAAISIVIILYNALQYHLHR